MKYIVALSALVVLAGCATGYQAQSFSGGFSETQLDTNVFKVTFKGNGYTHSERAEDFALLRSAEITLKHGFTHFAIVDGRQSADYGVMTTPTQSYTTGSVTSYGNTAYGSAHTMTTGGQSFIVKKPSTTNTIVCFNSKPDNGMFVYNAQFIYDSLSAKYGIKVGQ
jgi:hypothetical protein